MNTVEEMAEFIQLWDLVTQTQLGEEEDTITWRWTASGEYSTKSAYLAQFNGSHSTFQATALWQAHAEGKHKFFAWLLVQTKLLTADKLTKRNWPCNEQCCLCDQESESAAHLCLHCPFAREVWALVAIWTDNLITMPEQDVGVEDWWYSQLRGLPKEVRRLKAALLMYTAWNI
jgi:hypothetical protein